MGHAASGVSIGAALDRFFAAFYAARPVTATFTGVHDFDTVLPDWSPEGLGRSADIMRSLRRDLDAVGRVDDDLVSRFPEEADLALADGCLEIQLAEHDGGHFYRRNPALWTGEAIFGTLSLVTRPFAPADERLRAAVARLQATASFLADARRTLLSAPAAWKARALRECDAAELLFGKSLSDWLPQSGAAAATIAAAADGLTVAQIAFRVFAKWLRDDVPDDEQAPTAGAPLLELLLRRGHWATTSADRLLSDARLALDAAHEELARRIGALGLTAWGDVEQLIAAGHPTVEDYLPRFTRSWERFRRVADDCALVTWPEAPIRYVPIPPHTRDAAPLLYYLLYRSPAPFDRGGTHDYVVPPVEGVAPAEAERRLAAANDCAVALNHVVHHGGLGHHVQNWFASRSSSRIGRIAAVDAASRISMFCGGSLAEGWACYACDVMEEVDALTPLERASVQHTRVRLAARAVVDLALHRGEMSMTEAAEFFAARGLMPPATARAEAVKASMFPGTPSMYWLGTRAIHALRRQLRVQEPGSLSLRDFHDRFLSYGAIPVPLIARFMTNGATR